MVAFPASARLGAPARIGLAWSRTSDDLGMAYAASQLRGRYSTALQRRHKEEEPSYAEGSLSGSEASPRIPQVAVAAEPRAIRNAEPRPVEAVEVEARSPKAAAAREDDSEPVESDRFKRPRIANKKTKKAASRKRNFTNRGCIHPEIALEELWDIMTRQRERSQIITYMWVVDFVDAFEAAISTGLRRGVNPSGIKSLLEAPPPPSDDFVEDVADTLGRNSIAYICLMVVQDKDGTLNADEWNAEIDYADLNDPDVARAEISLRHFRRLLPLLCSMLDLGLQYLINQLTWSLTGIFDLTVDMCETLTKIANPSWTPASSLIEEQPDSFVPSSDIQAICRIAMESKTTSVESKTATNGVEDVKEGDARAHSETADAGDSSLPAVDATSRPRPASAEHRPVDAKMVALGFFLGGCSIRLRHDAEESTPEDRAARRIQGLIRARLARNRFLRTIVYEMDMLEEAAVLRVQAIFRGNMVRRRLREEREQASRPQEPQEADLRQVSSPDSDIAVDQEYDVDEDLRSSPDSATAGKASSPTKRTVIPEQLYKFGSFGFERMLWKTHVTQRGGVCQSTTNLMFMKAVRHMSGHLDTRGRIRNKNVMQNVSAPNANLRNPDALGRTEISAIIQLLFQSVPRKGVYSSPLDMCVSMVRFAH